MRPICLLAIIVILVGTGAGAAADAPWSSSGDTGRPPGDSVEQEDEGRPPGDSVEPKEDGSLPGTRDMELTYEMEPLEFVCMDANSMWNSYEFFGWEYLAYWYYGWAYHMFGVGEMYRESMTQEFGTTSKPGWFESKTLMRFDASPDAVPYMKQLLKAELVMAPNVTSNIGNVGVFRATDEWSLYGDFSDSSINGEYPGPIGMNRSDPVAIQQPTQAHQRYTWDITDLFRRWMDGSTVNTGIFLALQDPHDNRDPGTPQQCLIDLRYPVEAEGSQPAAPRLVITYIGNGAPVASIDEITPKNPVEGKTVQLNGSGTDPDGNGIASYKWRTGEMILAEGPDKESIEIDLPMGMHDIYFSVRDDDGEHPRWSEEVKRSVFVDSRFLAAPPQVIQVSAYVNNEEGFAFPEGSQITFVVTERDARTDLEGTISIIGTKGLWVNRDELVPGTKGNYTYTWYTRDVPPGTYWVDTTLTDPKTGGMDHDGMRPDFDMEINILDITPPVIGRVSVPVGVEGGVIQPGKAVNIQVWEANGETGLEGSIDISGPRSEPDILLTNRGNGVYDYIWDTEDWPEGDYEIDVTLMDRFGNFAHEEGADLMLTIMDTVPPAMLSVLTTQSATTVTLKVQMASQEEGLMGYVEVFGPDDFQEDLEELGEGWYSVEINTTGMEPGIYEVDIVLQDQGYNSIIGTSMFTIDSRNPPPTVTDHYPGDGDVVSGTDFSVEVSFSEPVRLDDASWAVTVWDSGGSMMAGTAQVVEDGMSVRFRPDRGWTAGEYYSVAVVPEVSDHEGEPINGFVRWGFSVENPLAPRIDGRDPSDNVEISPGSSREFVARFSNVDSVIWYTSNLDNGSISPTWSKAGTGEAFNFTARGTGQIGIRAAGTGPGGTISTVWLVKVETEGAPGDERKDDSRDVLDGGDSDFGASSGPVAAGVAVVGMILLLVPLVLHLRGRPVKGGGTRSNKAERGPGKSPHKVQGKGSDITPPGTSRAPGGKLGGPPSPAVGGASSTRAPGPASPGGSTGPMPGTPGTPGSVKVRKGG